MAIGQITKFPIETILEFATSAQHGICPQLSGSVHTELIDCDMNKAVSERGIRLTLDNIDTGIEYINLGHWYPVFSNLTAPTAWYNTLTADSKYITAFLSADTIFLSAYGDSNITGSISGNISGIPISVQGGKYQYSDMIEASAIPTSGYTIAYPNSDDLLAKTFIKCTVPFEQNGSTYSIGVSTENFEDKNLIMHNFNAPSAMGLVDFTYSNSMSSEYYWLTGDSEIRIYRNGSQCTSGELGISVFYDNVVWSPNYGYVIGNYRYELPTQRFNLDFDYLDVSERMQPSYNYSDYVSIGYNSYIYTAGGENSISLIYNNINRYETKNDTCSELDRGDLSLARSRLSIAKSSIKSYFIGGAHRVVGLGEVQYSRIDNIQFSNDTANAVANANLNTARSENYSVQSSLAFYCGGGDNTTNVGISLSSIEKLVFINDTVINIISSSLNTGRERHSGWSNNINGYFTSGIDEITSNSVNELDILNFSTDNIASYSNHFNIPVGQSSSVQNSINGYLLGGTINSNKIEIIQKTNFNTITNSIVVGKLLNNNKGYGASV